MLPVILLQVLGRGVYTSNNQLGGIQIMHKNGVSHTTVKWDFDGIATALRWLSYIPKAKDAPLPILLNPQDVIERDVEFIPTKCAYDPRHMLTGVHNPGFLYVTLIQPIYVFWFNDSLLMM